MDGWMHDGWGGWMIDGWLDVRWMEWLDGWIGELMDDG